MPNHNESISIVVREFQVNKDTERVVTLENTCEVGPTNKLSLFTDMLGDPICRLRNSPSFLMLVYNHLIIHFHFTIPFNNLFSVSVVVSGVRDSYIINMVQTGC